jgi:hypothetical protein
MFPSTHPSDPEALPRWAAELQTLYQQMAPIPRIQAQLPSLHDLSWDTQDIVVRALGLQSPSPFVPNKKYTASVVKMVIRLAEDGCNEVHEELLNAILSWMNVGNSNSQSRGIGGGKSMISLIYVNLGAVVLHPHKTRTSTCQMLNAMYTYLLRMLCYV